jgi:hypothetical protein
VVLRLLGDGQWQLLGEVRRRPGITARAARSAAISEVTGGTAGPGEVYAAILRSEWLVAQDWLPPSEGPRRGR